MGEGHVSLQSEAPLPNGAEPSVPQILGRPTDPHTFRPTAAKFATINPWGGPCFHGSQTRPIIKGGASFPKIRGPNTDAVTV